MDPRQLNEGFPLPDPATPVRLDEATDQRETDEQFRTRLRATFGWRVRELRAFADFPTDVTPEDIIAPTIVNPTEVLS